uniref:Lipid A biosynthesis lauroyl/palmitoleoyl acyltransferase n=1 Tax=bacterium enrichment culture TaxID=207831 RepID=A0A0R7N6L3_9BACT|nr:lipid A biosynthesis lauroyl/palmitoleoyl acyltransferase [bacterium enrichment culture]
MKLLLKAIAWIPLPVLYPTGWFLYFVTFHILRWNRERATLDIANAFPGKSAAERHEILRQSYRNLGDMIMEMIWGFGASLEDMKRRVVIENPEVVRSFIDAKKPVLLLTAHFCNWEWLLLGGAAHFGVPIDAVYQPQRVKSIDRYLRDARARFGASVIAREDFIVEIMKRSGDARAYALLADRTPRREHNKYWTRFLNQDTAFFIGAGKVLTFLDASAFYVHMRRVKRGHYSVRLSPLAGPPFDDDVDEQVSERYARNLEQAIVESPADWLWLQRKWKYPKSADEPRRRPRRARGAAVSGNADP